MNCCFSKLVAATKGGKSGGDGGDVKRQIVIGGEGGFEPMVRLNRTTAFEL
jgi:hypothetical protein